jgi:uncharacterized membrane protein
MAITRYAGDRFTTNTSDTKPTGVLDGAYLIDTGNLTQYVRRTVGGASQWTQLAGGGGGGGTPGGSNTQVQFNNAGAFGGNANLTFDGSKLAVNDLALSGIIYDSNNSIGNGGMVLTNEGTTGVNWKSIESVLSGVGGSGVANYVARWSDEDTLTSGTIFDNGDVGIGTANPGGKLHVFDTVISDMVILESSGPSAADGPDVVFYRNSASPADGDDLGKLVFRGRNDNSQDVNYANIIAEAIDVSDGTEDGALKFYTYLTGANTETMVLRSANVGIGTNAPDAHLHIEKSVGATTVLTEVAANSTVGYEIKKTGSTTQHWKIVDGQTANGYLEIYDATDSATRMAFNTAGNVGIGTVNAGQLLTIKGDSKYFGAYASDGSLSVLLGTDANGDGQLLLADVNGTTKVLLEAEADANSYINNGGNFGLGTAAPAAPLDVQSANGSSVGIRVTNGYKIQFLNGSNNTNSNIYNNGASGVAQLDFQIAGATKVTIDNDGNVGIGTNAPATKLHVEDSTSNTTATKMTVQGGSRGFTLGKAQTADNYAHLRPITDTANALRVMPNGTTAREAYVEVWNKDYENGANSTSWHRGMFYIDTSNDVYLRADGYGTAGRVFIGTENNTQTLTIKDNGRVGVGTNAPNTLLHLEDDTATAGLTIQGAGPGYVNAAIVLKATNGTGVRGLGVFMHDAGGDTEWYAGTPYAAADNYVIARKASQASPDYGTAIMANALFTIDNNGNVGLGITDPAHNLHVSGDAIISGYLYDSTNSTGVDGYVLTSKEDGPQWKMIEDVLSGVGGNGTANYVSKWVDSDTIGNSIIYDDGDVGISTASPDAKLHVFDTVVSDLAIFESSGPSSANAPDVVLYRSSASPADADDLGRIAFRGRNDNSQDINYANIIAEAIDVSDGTEDGALRFNTYLTGVSTETMVLRSANVGIGTNAPNAKLEVYSDGSIAQGAEIRLQHANNNSTDIVSTVNFANNAGSVAMIQAGTTGANNSGYISLFTDNAGTSAERMRIISDGKVGIGTNTPANTLHVQKDVDDFVVKLENDGNSTSSDGLWLDTRWNTASNTVLKVTSNSGSADFFYIKGDGNVGIGTNAPLSKFNVLGAQGNWRVDPDSVSNEIQVLSTTIANDGFRTFRLRTNETIFDTGGSERMRILSDGKVGIGVISPAHKLTVASGDIGVTGGQVLVVSGATSAPSFAFTNDTDTGISRPTTNAVNIVTAGTERVRVDANGNVGIGTVTPATELHAHGTTLTGRTSGDTGSYVANSYDLIVSNGGSGTVVLLYNDAGAFQSSLIKYDTNCLKLGLNSSNSTNAISTATAVNIGSVGVGIGTDDPGSKLEVYAASGLVASHVKSGTVISRLTANSTASDGVVGTSSAHDFLIQRAGSTRMTFSGSSVVVNDSGEDIDFRVEGDTDANLIRTDAANDRVGIGTNAPLAKLMVGAGTRNAGAAVQSQTAYFIGTKSAFADPAYKGLWQGQLHIADDSALAAGIGGAITFGATQDNTNGTFLASIEGSRDNATSGQYGASMIFRTRTNGSAVMGAHMVINSVGNVGIGTDDPAYLLDVYETGSNIAIFRSTSTGYARVVIRAGASGDAQLVFQEGTTSKWRIGNDGGDSDKFKIDTGSGAFDTSPMVAIDTTGKVGIGVSPTTHQLEVSGGSYNSNLKLKGAGASAGILFADSDNNTDGYVYAAGTNIGFLDAGTDWMVRCVNDQFIYFATNGNTEHMRITSAGNVGIGTDNPTTNLHIRKIDLVDDSRNALLLLDGKFAAAGVNSGDEVGIAFRVENSGGGAQQTTSITSSYQASYNSLNLQPAGGNVGIGVNDPAKLLTVKSATSPVIGLYSAYADSNARNWAIASNNAAYGDFTISNSAANGGDPTAIKLSILKEGSVGIGTNAPETQLHVEGALFASSSIKMERTGAAAGDNDAGLIFSTSSARTDSQRIGGVYFGAAGTNYGLIRGEMDGSAGGKIYFVAGSQTNPISNTSAKTLEITAGTISAKAAIRPLDDSTYTLGQSSLKWSELYVDSIKDVNNNTGSANQVLSAGSGGGSLDWVSLSEITGVDGSGTANTIPRWTDSDTIGDSIITVPSNTSVQVAGPLTATGNITVGPSNNSKIYMGGNDYIAFTDGVGDGFKFVYDNSEKVRITNVGNVGIGTNDPEAPLTVAGPTGNQVVFRTDQSTASQRAGGGFSSLGHATATSRYARLFLDADGANFGGVDYFTIEKFGNSGEVKLLQYSNSNMSFWVNTSTQAMTIKNDGNVGIGTDQPLNLLMINGSSPIIRFRDSNASGTPLAYIDASDGALKLQADASDETASSFLTLEVDGSEHVRVIADGNVGIGTNNPGEMLQVGDGSVNSTSIEINSASWAQLKLTSPNTNGAYIMFGDPEDEDIGNIFYYHGSNANYMSFTTNASEQMRIDKNGNVGIGTNNPDYLLHIEGTGPDLFKLRATTAGSATAPKIHFEHSSGGTQTANIIFDQSGQNKLVLSTQYQSATDENLIQFAPADNVAMTIRGGTGSSDGFVGIGTETPGAPVHIFSDGTSNTPEIVLCLGANTSNAPTLQFSENTNAGFNTGMSIAYRGDYGAGDANALAIQSIGADATTSGAPVVTFKSGGNVGIGTTTPEGLLSFKADESNTPKIRFQNQHSVTTDAAISTYDDASGTTVLIGSNLYINSSGATTRFNTGEESAGFRADRGGLLQFFTGETGATATERIRVLADGNVGIGTDAPSEKLDVEGSLVVNVANSGLGEEGIFFRRGFSDSNKYNISILAYAHDGAGNFSDGISINGYDGVSFCTGASTRQERMRIVGGTGATSGFVGIGTDNPFQLLHVYQVGTAPNGYYEGAVKVGGSTASLGAFLGYNASSSGRVSLTNLNNTGGNNALISFGFGAATDGTPDTLALAMNQNGNVGVGTNVPWAGFHVLRPTLSGFNGLIYNVVIASSNTYANGHAGGINFAGAYNSSETQTSLAGIWASRPNAGDGQYGGMVHIGAREHGTSNIAKVINVSHASVGIGTAAPAALLHVYGSASSAYLAEFTNTHATQGYGVLIKAGDDNNVTALSVNDKDGNEKLRVRAGGEITFANAFTFPTADGSNGQFLQTNGSGTVTWASAGSGTVTGSGTASYVPKFTSSTAIGNSALFDGGGNNIGIGTNNPQGQLQLHSTASAVQRLVFSNTNSNLNPQQRIEFWESAATSTSTNAHAAIEYVGSTAYESSDGTLLVKGYGSSANLPIAGFNRNGNVYLGMSGTRRVGINTLTPAKDIDLKYSSNNSAGLDGSGLSGGAAGNGILINNTATNVSSYANLDFRAHNADGRIAYRYDAVNQGSFHFITDNDSAGFVNAMSIMADGHVGIGTNDPAQILDVYETGSNLGIFRSTATNYARLLIRSGSTGDAQLAFQNNTSTKWSIGNDGGDSDKFKIAVGAGAFSTSEAVTISTSGCVGIGTNAPLEPLHVYDAGDWQIRMSSGGARAGLVIDKPGTTTTMGSALVVAADETYRLGTASYYHVVMQQGGTVSLQYQGSTRLNTTSGGVTVTGTLTETSSITLKENVETYTPSLDIINKIRPVKYNRKTNKDKKEIGLIAEELAELFPELVEKDEKGNPSSVNYSRAVTVLLGGFKELYKEIEELKKRI